MNGLGKTMKRTRLDMIENVVDSVADEFTKRFGLSEGDYLEFMRHNNANGVVRTPCRIAQVEDCYYNARGGYTAVLKVIPLLQNGSLGNTRRLTLAVNANGTGIKGVGHEVTIKR